MADSITTVLASFAQPCIACGAKADHTIEVCDVRASREPRSARNARIAADPEIVAIRAFEEIERKGRCGKCNGTGIYVGMGVTTCFPCAGKGFITEADSRRNWGYNRYQEQQMAASIIAEIEAAQKQPDLPIDGPTMADEADDAFATREHMAYLLEVEGA